MLSKPIVISFALFCLGLTGTTHAHLPIANQRRDVSLTQPLPPPSAKPDGRGVAIENLVVRYGADYENDPYLKDDVVLFRRWQWQALYDSLQKKTQERPDHLDTYRLQAEAYFINKEYQQALSQLDLILTRNPFDKHALAMTVLACRVLGDKNQEQRRLAWLGSIDAHLAEKLTNMFAFVEAWLEQSYDDEPKSQVAPDTIAVFGSSPNPDGTPSAGMLKRLYLTKKMADRFSDAIIIVSGGPVKTPFSEAQVMADWLVAHGIDGNRILLDDQARDTPGNAIGMITLMRRYQGKRVLAVATRGHIPRASAVLKSYADHVHYPIVVDSVGGGEPLNPQKAKIEALYTYVNVARVSGLFTKSDFQ